jgi:hypothetical protein
VSKPQPPPRTPSRGKRPAQPPSGRRSGPAAGWRLWLLLTVTVAVVVVAVVWLSGGSGGGGGQPAGGVRAVGEAAPAVRLASTSGQTVDVASFRGKRNVLLYFYEHAG